MRGPGPSCALAGRVALRGKAGANRYRFDGRIARRPLEPGTYQLTLRRRGHKKALGRTLVTIVAPGATAAGHVAPDCTGTPAEPATPSLAAGPPAAAHTAAAVPPAPTARIVRVPPPDRESPPFAVPPALQLFDEPDELPLVLGLAVLGLLVVSLLGILVEVVRHVRSSHA